MLDSKFVGAISTGLPGAGLELDCPFATKYKQHQISNAPLTATQPHPWAISSTAAEYRTCLTWRSFPAPGASYAFGAKPNFFKSVLFLFQLLQLFAHRVSRQRQELPLAHHCFLTFTA